MYGESRNLEPDKGYFMKKSVTERGFPIAEFTDRYKQKCSIQISSLADDRCIWFGLTDPDPKIMAIDALAKGIDTNGQSVGWVKYPIPDEVLLSTRMHLTMDQVKELLPVLQKFAETGEI